MVDNYIIQKTVDIVVESFIKPFTRVPVVVGFSISPIIVLYYSNCTISVFADAKGGIVSKHVFKENYLYDIAGKTRGYLVVYDDGTVSTDFNQSDFNVAHQFIKDYI